MTASSETPKKVTLTHIAHVHYKHASASAAKQFALDFGFTEVPHPSEPNKTYYRGYGTEPFLLDIEDTSSSPTPTTAFGGAAFAVASEADLELAVAALPPEAKATGVQTLTSPGGGKGVTFYDPVDGFPFHLVWGQEKAERWDPRFPTPRVNYPQEKNRPANTFARFEKRPAPVHKLGHFGMCVTNFAKAYDFYSKHFNFFPSELVHNTEGVNETVFFRLDRGQEKVDHHIFFLFEGPKWHVHHTSYETHDFDTQVLGHDWLRHKGYENCWGVGRHVMGSQIFDYWFDPSGFIMEHYVDGDLLNMDEPTHQTAAKDAHLHVWGPEVPPTFLQ